MRVETVGNANLYLADCADVIPRLQRMDLLVTDPPYGIGFASQPTRYQRANGLKAKEWDKEAPQARIDAARQLCDAAVIWGGNYLMLPPSRGWLIWVKEGNAPSMADCELAWTSFDMNSRTFRKTVKSASLEKDLQRAPHPTQKPVALMEWSIGFLSAARSIFDPFMGSGTTGVACARMGLPFVGVEIDPEYFDISCERIRAAQSQQRLFA